MDLNLNRRQSAKKKAVKFVDDNQDGGQTDRPLNGAEEKIADEDEENKKEASIKDEAGPGLLAAPSAGH
jgi:hypothetical protein